MASSTEEKKLEDLNARIQAIKVGSDAKAQINDHHSRAHLAWRMVIELVVGIIIGFGIGYGLDILLGTIPLFMVLFIILGFAAGVSTMLRSAKGAQEQEATEMINEKEG